MAGKDVASMLGISSAAAACNRAGAAENPKPAADRSPINPMRDSEARAYDGFEGSLEERVRQLELENDILRGVAKVLKAESPNSLTNREKTPVVNELRATTGRSLKEPADSLRISKSSYECRRKALAKPDKYAALRARVRGMFEAANGSRELRSSEDSETASEKVVRSLMREKGLVVAYAKKRAKHGSCKGEISEAPENLVGRKLGADAPNRLWLTDITEFGLPGGKACLSPILDCFDGGLPAWSIGTRPDARLANGSLEAGGALGPGGATADGRDGLRYAKGAAWSDRCRRITYNLLRTLTAA